MPKICYVGKNFAKKSQAIIDQANLIIEEYQADGYDLTLRQLYYQFVSRDLIANKQSEYKRLGGIISDGRLAGLIDWYAIIDRTRNRAANSHWDNPGQIIESAAAGFYKDRWEGQDYYVEVWIEKEALIGVISGICNRLDVSYFACKGYVSQSEMWSAGQRLGHQRRMGKQPIIVHLGDHDPSGMDMTRDIFDRHFLFDSGAKVERIALNMDQIRQYNPPPNPAKFTDSRAKEYVKEFGTSSWELDALNPRVLSDLIEERVLSYRDEEAYQVVIDDEDEGKEILERIADNWETL